MNIDLLEKLLLRKLVQDLRKNISTVSTDGGYWAARIDNVLKGKK